jgi:hypothetical protein
MGTGRREGCADGQLKVVVAAHPNEFVETRTQQTCRLWEEKGDAYTWRNILAGWLRSATLLNHHHPLAP